MERGDAAGLRARFDPAGMEAERRARWGKDGAGERGIGGHGIEGPYGAGHGGARLRVAR